jgi:short-subunit dehydrogenase
MGVHGEGEGKTALITGASSGIGWHLAQEFGAHGFDLVLVARTGSKLEQLASRVETEHGVKCLVRPTDLLQPGAPQKLFDDLRAWGIPIEVLVNDAGVLRFGPFKDTRVADLLDIVNLNATALTAMTRLFVEPMIRGGGGRILNVASLGAFQPMPSLAVYGATKAYILSLSEALSEELRDTGVTVTALCPGFTTTAMLDEIGGARSFAERMPRGTVLEPERVAIEGYRACMEGAPVHVPGISNQLAVRLVGWQPRWLVRALGGLIGRRVM